MSLRVHPTFVPAASPLATVSGADNAVLVTGHAVGDTFYVGPGAGEMPTASSIVADIVDAAIGRAQITFDHVAWLAGRRTALPVMPIQETRSRYYLRFDVLDKPGVLAAMAGVLGRHEISVASVLQQETPSPKSVPVRHYDAHGPRGQRDGGARGDPPVAGRHRSDRPHPPAGGGLVHCRARNDELRRVAWSRCVVA